MVDLKIPTMYKPETGEVLKHYEYTPTNIKAYLSTLTDAKLAEYFTKLNYLRRIMVKIETIVKDLIKNKVGDFDETAMFEDIKLSKTRYTRFDEKKLLKEGTPNEIKVWNRLKKKYTSTVESVRI